MLERSSSIEAIVRNALFASMVFVFVRIQRRKANRDFVRSAVDRRNNSSYRVQIESLETLYPDESIEFYLSRYEDERRGTRIYLINLNLPTEISIRSIVGHYSVFTDHRTQFQRVFPWILEASQYGFEERIEANKNHDILSKF